MWQVILIPFELTSSLTAGNCYGMDDPTPQAHRRCNVLEREHLPKLVAKHQVIWHIVSFRNSATMVTSAQASTADVFGLRQRLAQVEGENTRLKGQLSHAEVREFVVTDQRMDWDGFSGCGLP